MNFKDIPILKELNESSIKSIEENAKFLSFEIGKPIASETILQSNIIFILSGNARLLETSDNKLITIAKLGPGSFIGLGSLLRCQACEQVRASSTVKALSIPDHLIIDLYSKDITFKNLCDKSLFPAEVLAQTKLLISNSNRQDINLLAAFNAVVKNAKLITSIDNSSFSDEENSIIFMASSNTNSFKIGDQINEDISFKFNGAFLPRFIKIPKNLYNEFMNNSSKKITQKEESIKDISFESAPIIPAKTSLSVGEYSPKKDFKIIRATGPLRETIACIQMLANEFNLPSRKDALEKIIRDEIKRGKKPSLTLCGGLTSMLGLYSVGSQIEISLANRLPINCLIPWNESFAIIRESNEKGIALVSPKDGFIRIPIEKFKDYFKNKINFLLVERNNRTPNKRFGINWFLPSLKKYKDVLFQVFIASFVVQLFGLANPLLIQVIIDKVISQRSLDTLQILGIGLVLVTILGGIIGSLRTFLFAETTNRIDTRLGSEVIDHLLRLPLNYFDKRPVGELGTRVAELEKIRDFLTGQALTTILDAAFSVIYIVVMVLYSWLLTFIALGVVPIQICLTLLGSPLLRRQIRETAKQNALTQSHLVEVLTGVQTVKAQNVETVSRWKWQELYGKYISRTFEKTITITALSQTSQVLQQLSQLLVLWVGASLVLDGRLTLGQLIAFRIISGYVTQPLLRLSSIWQNIQELRVSFERLADIIDTQEESNEKDKANIPIPQIEGNISFKNVSFKFNNNSPNVINNVSLDINKGEFVGIAGQSGSGKSTLMKLLPRLYDVEVGKILVDNYDISKVELYSLRRQIGIVPQDPLLFSGSVSENIALTNPEVGSDEIVRAAKIADAHSFIMTLPEGYSTNVGERGASLSGGQRQRIAIARTILSNPTMLVMDEATSALDYETERRVCENLRESCKNSTVLFITHRLSTIRNADKIVMMHEGNVVETGLHKELMEKQGRYYALYRQQESN